MLIQIVIAIVATLVIVAPITWIISSKAIARRNDATIGNANEKAREIIDEALKVAETKKKEALLEAKEENLKARNELEKETERQKDSLKQAHHRIDELNTRFQWTLGACITIVGIIVGVCFK